MSNTTIATTFTNLDFETGASGEIPPGWWVRPNLINEGFSVVLTTNQPAQGRQCAELRWPTNHTPPAEQFANMSQGVDATAWRGQLIRVTAAMRLASSENDQRAQMWFRVDGPKGVSAFDNMNKEASTRHIAEPSPILVTKATLLGGWC